MSVEITGEDVLILRVLRVPVTNLLNPDWLRVILPTVRNGTVSTSLHHHRNCNDTHCHPLSEHLLGGQKEYGREGAPVQRRSRRGLIYMG